MYLKVKSQSNGFKYTLGDTFTGDELFHLIIKFQSLYEVALVTPEDKKWMDKLISFLGPFPVVK